MPYDDPSPRIEQIRQTDRTGADLEEACRNAAEVDEDVVVAERVFPAKEYKFLYDRHYIAIVEARLIRRGYAVDTKIVMNDKCSQLVLVIEKDRWSDKEVHAERIAKGADGK